MSQYGNYTIANGVRTMWPRTLEPWLRSGGHFEIVTKNELSAYGGILERLTGMRILMSLVPFIMSMMRPFCIPLISVSVVAI